MGMLAGSLVVSYISSKWATWTAMIFLLAIHLGTNYLAVRAVCMQTLNRQRANLVFSSLLEQLAFNQIELGTSKSRPLRDPMDLTCPNPEEVRLQERVFERDGVLRWRGEVLGYCKLGVNLKTVLDCFTWPDKTTGSHSGSRMREFSKLLEVFKGSRYIVWYDEPRKTFLVVLEDGAGPINMLLAWMFALQFAKYGNSKQAKSLIEALGVTRSYLSRIEDGLIQRVRENWDLEVSAMETQSGTRIRMKNEREL
jgi:hypothetical protein